MAVIQNTRFAEETLPERLVRARTSKGFTQSEVANSVEVSLGKYADYEAGLDDVPHSVLARLANKLSTTSDWLLGLSDVDDLEAMEMIVRLVQGHQFSGIDTQVFAKRLVELRKIRDISQGDFAQYLNTSQNVVVCYERGTTSPGLFKAIRMSILLGCSLDYLFGLEDEDRGNPYKIDEFTPDLEVFVTRVVNRRNELGMSQAKLGALCGIHSGLISGYENHRHQPNVSTVARIAAALEVSLDYLSGLSDEKK